MSLINTLIINFALNLIIMILNMIPLFIGWPQVVLIAVVILLIFGGKKIPELMRGLGSGIKEFKDASKEEEEENKKE